MQLNHWLSCRLLSSNFLIICRQLPLYGVLLLSQLWILCSRDVQSEPCLTFLHPPLASCPSVTLVLLPFRGFYPGCSACLERSLLSSLPGGLPHLTEVSARSCPVRWTSLNTRRKHPVIYSFFLLYFYFLTLDWFICLLYVFPARMCVPPGQSFHLLCSLPYPQLPPKSLTDTGSHRNAVE